MNSKLVAIIGYGAFGEQIKHLISAENPHAVFTFFDDVYTKTNPNQGKSFQDYSLNEYQHHEFYVCLGYNHAKAKVEIIRNLEQLNRKIGTFIHPSAFIDSSAQIGHGTIIYPLCNVGQNVQLGKGVVLNNSVVVSHDTEILDGSYLSPGVIISGRVKVGSECFVGSGSILSNNIEIGDRVLIGLGTVLTDSIASGASVIGNPARILSKPLRLA